MPTTRRYPAKLLLFGEYTVIFGAKALAFPLFTYKGQWQRISGKEKKLEPHQQGLRQIADHCKKYHPALIDIPALEDFLQQDFYFASKIPGGYGLGSSGAVTAAVYERFALRKIEPNETKELATLQQQLARIESCFHGNSSGADPLVSYLQRGILFDNQCPFPLSGSHSFPSGFFLLDTGITRQTGPWVALFNKWCNEPSYTNRLEAELILLVEDAIDATLHQKNTDLLDLMHLISHFQYKYFTDMIPTPFQTAWLDCLASSHTKLKLCGAGGGGFLLGFTTNPAAAKKLLSAYQLVVL